MKRNSTPSEKGKSIDPSSPHTRKLTRSASIFTVGTMLSRILGFARDSMVANYFGAGPASDAFYAAFRIANLFRRLLGEGALSASFVPVFSEYVEKKSPEETQRFLNVMFTTLVTVLITLTTLGIIFAPQVTRVIAMGFEKTPERFELTVQLTRIMFPFLLFISMAALITGVLNAAHSFFLPALAPASMSVAEMAYLAFLTPFIYHQNQIVGLAVSVTVGGFLQFFIHLPALREKGWTIRWVWDWTHEGMRRVAKLMGPATIGVSVDQVNAFVDTMVASYLREGAVTALYYSNRVMQLPLALFGIALSQVSLPAMSASVARGDTDQLRETLNFSLRVTMFMILPAMTGLIVLGEPIVRVLFERGQFTSDATALTNSALLYYSLGLLAYSWVKILANSFYAFQNTRFPVIVAAICVVINVSLNLLLMKPMGVGGLALATAVASWVNACVLLEQMRKKIKRIGARSIIESFLKSAIGCLVMSVVAYGLVYAPVLHVIPLVIRLMAGIVLGGLSYFVVSYALKMSECETFLSALRRRSA